jgi:putative endopeptidase
MKKLIAITLLAAACGSKKEPEQKAAPTPTVPTTPDNPGSGTGSADAPVTPDKPVAPPPASDKPELGAWGFDADGMDKAAAPGTSFYEFANGAWLKKTEIPADKSNYGMFTALDDRSQERTKEIIQKAKGEPDSEGKKIADYYQSFMDEAAIEAKGSEPIKPELDKIAAIKDATGVSARFAESSRVGRKSPLGTIVVQDEKDPEHHIAMLAQSGLGLPDRDMYDAKKGKQFAAVRDGYKKYIGTMLGLVGTADAEKRAAAVYALEEKIAAVHWTRVQNRDPVKTYNKLSIA